MEAAGQGGAQTRRSRACAKGRGRGRKRGSGGRGSSRRRRRASQSAGGLASRPANQPPPRAQCLARRAFLHHVRVRWAVAGYKRLRPSGRPPFWGSFRGKFGCSVAVDGNVWPAESGRPGQRAGRAGMGSSGSHDGPAAAVCPDGPRGRWGAVCLFLRRPRTDYIFLLLCSFHPRLNFLGERQAGHQENKRASATPKPLKGS